MPFRIWGTFISFCYDVTDLPICFSPLIRRKKSLLACTTNSETASRREQPRAVWNIRSSRSKSSRKSFKLTTRSLPSSRTSIIPTGNFFAVETFSCARNKPLIKTLFLLFLLQVQKRPLPSEHVLLRPESSPRRSEHRRRVSSSGPHTLGCRILRRQSVVQGRARFKSCRGSLLRRGATWRAEEAAEKAGGEVPHRERGVGRGMSQQGWSAYGERVPSRPLQLVWSEIYCYLFVVRTAQLWHLILLKQSWILNYNSVFFTLIFDLDVFAFWFHRHIYVEGFYVLHNKNYNS